KRIPNSKNILEREYSLYVTKGDFVHALDNIMYQLKLRPWDMTLYERAIVLNFQLGENSKQISNNKYWNDALSIYDGALNDKLKEIKLMPDSVQRWTTFKVTPKIALTIGKI